MDVDIEVESGIFNTSNSRLWSKLRLYFAEELKQEYINMRNSGFTLENMLKYFYEKQIEKIPVRYYNKSTEFKYLNYGSQYLYACHGNRYFQIKRWLKERLLYCDTLFGFEPTTSNFITVRCNKQGKVYMNISTYSPMYLSVKWRDEADGSGTQTLKIPRGKSVQFSYTIPTATDQEVIIYGAEHIKSLGDLSNCNPTHLLLSNAVRINEVVCKNSSKLVNAQIDGCDYLQTINFNGCSNLGTLNSAQSLVLTNCNNLKYLDIRGTKITNIDINKNGGNLVEIYLPKTITSLDLRNQYSLKIIGLTYTNYSNCHHTEALSGSSDITEFTLINCPLVERLTASDYTNMNNTVYDFNGNARNQSTIGEYEDANKFKRMLIFGMGLCNATKIHIEKSMLNTKEMSFRFMYRLEELTLKYLPNLEELTLGNTQTGHTWNTDDMCGSFDFNNINTTECPNLKTVRLHQFDWRQDKWFNSSSNTLDLTRFPNLETFTCNITTQDLETIILPSTLKKFWIKGNCNFTTTGYTNQCLQSKCTLKNIYFKDDHEDGYEGIDFGGRLLNELCLSHIPQATGTIMGVNTKNTYVNPIFNNIDNKTKESTEYPLVKVQGLVDLSSFDWTEAHYWFANIDFANDDIEFMMPNDWDYLIDNRLTRVRGLFYNCSNDDFTWDFGARFFKLLNDRFDLVQTYRHATLKEQVSYEESAVTLENDYNIADYNYGDTPFYNANLKYVNSCTLRGNGIAYGTFRSSKLVKIGTFTCSGESVWWSSEYLFANSANLEEVGTVNMPRGTSTISWFRDCPKLKKVGKINAVGNNINNMYNGCKMLTQYALPDISNCTNMQNAFTNCDSLTSIYLKNITESTPLENIREAFSYCDNLITITMDGKKLPTTLTDMNGTFRDCPKLTNVLPLPNDFDNKCTMIHCCRNSDSLTDDTIYKIFPYNVSNMDYVYYGCDGLVNPRIIVNSDRTSSQNVFYGCVNIKTLRAEFNGTYSYGFNSFAEGCSNLTDVYLRFPYSLYFNEDRQTCVENRYMFAYCRRLVNVEFDMSRLESKSDFYGMFRQDKYIETIRGFDISKIKNDERDPNKYDGYITYDTSFEFITDWKFINGNGEGLTSSYRFYNLELVPLATLASIIDNLGTVQNQTLRMNQATIERLTNNQIASAVAKGWTITT